MIENKNGCSRRTYLKAAAKLVGLAAVAPKLISSAPSWGAEKDAASEATFTNPLFAGDYPDASILRVGSDFYMTHTSFGYTPGLLVWHSRDLVNWLPISNAIREVHGEVWAPDLVEYEGHYYIYFPMNGIFVVHADHPRGPWSKPIDLHVGGIDPGHVTAPDGKRYLYTAGCSVVELTRDGLSTVGKSRHVYSGWSFPKDWKTEGMWLESPKLTRRGDYYYLINAEGGTAGPPTSHMAVVARASSPLGPWENSPHNPLIHTYNADEQWWSVGHATLVSTPDDRWYLVYHGYLKNFQTLGRQTLMEPIEWTADGWPLAPLGARRNESMAAPMSVAQRPMIDLSDNFHSPQLQATWVAWNESDLTRFQSGGGSLKIRGKGASYAQSSPLIVKARDPSYSVSVNTEIDNDSAAALALQYDPGYAVYVQLSRGKLEAFGPKHTNLASLNWPAMTAVLRMINRQNLVSINVSANGQDWQNVVSDFDVSHFTHNDRKGGYQATSPALAGMGNGVSRFSEFRYSRL